MKSEEEIREMLEDAEERQEELMRESYEKPVRPDGSADQKHLAAISNRGFIGALEKVLGEE